MYCNIELDKSKGIHVTIRIIINEMSSRLSTLCTTRFNTQNFCVLPTQCMYVFCVDLRTNDDY